MMDRLGLDPVLVDECRLRGLGETVGMVSLAGILLIAGSTILVAIRCKQADGPLV